MESAKHSLAKAAEATLGARTGTHSKALPRGPSQSYSGSAWSPGSSYQGCSGMKCVLSEKGLSKWECLVPSVVDGRRQSDPPRCPQIPPAVSRDPSAVLCGLCFWRPRTSHSPWKTTPGAALLTVQEPECLDVCPLRVTLTNDCRRESRKLHSLEQSWDILSAPRSP